MEHNFLVASFRPQLIEKQVLSFYQNKLPDSQINFYIFDDANERNDECISSVSKLNKLPNLEVIYLPLSLQIEIIRKFASKYGKKDHEFNKEAILECFKEGKKFRGVRSIQNKSIFIFYLLNKNKKSIVHKLDDDIFCCLAKRNQDAVSIEYNPQYFSIKEQTLRKNPRVISVSAYTVDSPSPLVDYTDSVELIANLLKYASSKEPSDSVWNNYSNFLPGAPRVFKDKTKLIGLLPPESNQTYQELIQGLESYIDLIQKGSTRLNLIDNSRDFDNLLYPGGGCVSFNYTKPPLLMPLFGNQDILWLLFSRLEGRPVVTDSFIGHIKSLIKRRPILEDLVGTSYKHQTKLTFSIFHYLYSKMPDNRHLKKFKSNFIDRQVLWLSEAGDFTKSIIEICQNGSWFLNQKFQALDKILRLCKEFDQRKTLIRQNYAKSEDIKASLIIKNYKKLGKIFSKVLKIAIEDLYFKNKHFSQY